MAIAALLVASYALLVNLLAFALFGIDKRRAEAGSWRIRESTLLGVALAGGWTGAKAGQRIFRHKTRKQPFGRRLNAAGLVNLGLATMLVAAALAPPDQVEAATGWMSGTLEALMPDVQAWGQGDPEPRAMPRRFGPGSADGM